MQQAWQTLDTTQAYCQLQSHVSEYKYHICAGVLIAAYGALCYHFYYAQQFVKHHAFWATWHKEMSLQELLSQDMRTLTQELLVVIQALYTNEKNPTDFILPLVDFSVAIQKELDTLRRYQRTYHWCKKWHLIKPLPFHTPALEEIDTAIERTTYIQTLFKNWAAHHNVACQMQCAKKKRGLLQSARTWLGI